MRTLQTSDREGRTPDQGYISRKFVQTVFGSMVVFAAVIAGFVAFADPYGVSPIQVARPGFNSTKLKRLNIDRQLKPYEVLRYQPDTVFIGTSRVNQSLDPAAFDGTRFGLAYNAAIPASTLAENAASLSLFFRLSPGIKNVMMEVFFYNFTRDQAPTPVFNLSQVATDAVALQFSFQALRQAIDTVQYNRITDAIPAHTEPRGYWVPDSWAKTGELFNLRTYISSVILSERAATLAGLRPSAIDRLDEIVELCRRNGAELSLVMLPSHPWDDYRLLSLGHWQKLEDYYRLLARYENVVSFTQPNEVTQEPAHIGMRWWYDPVHPSLNMGRMALRALNGDLSGAPGNFMARITPEAIDNLLAERKAAAKQWAVDNPEFVEQFEAEKARVLH